MKTPSPEDICYNFFHFPSGKEKKITLLKKILQYVKIVFCIIESFFIPSNRKEYSGSSVIFIIGSGNHFSVFSKFKPYINFDFDIWNKLGYNEKAVEYSGLPVPGILKQIAILIFLLKKEIHNSPLSKANIDRVLIFRVYKNFLGAVDLFKRSNIKSIVLFNDHVAWYRAFLFAGKKTRVKTIYIPHASVSGRFPKLEFDYAFIEGDDMKEKYLNIGPTDTKMIMVGNCKFDRYRKNISNPQVFENDANTIKIGIAFNLLSEAKAVQNLQLFLSNALNKDFLSKKLEIFIRPHPNLVIKTSHYFKTVSDARFEDSLTFIDRLDLLLATNSNIILESLLMNCPVLHIDVTGSPHADNYGFVSKGLVNSALSNREDIYKAILSFIIEKKGISAMQREMLKTYDYSLGSKFEGTVGQLIAKELERIASN